MSMSRGRHFRKTTLSAVGSRQQRRDDLSYQLSLKIPGRLLGAGL